MSHISFSAFKIFNECPYKYKLIYEDKVQRAAGSLHTSFGTALHEAAELKVQDSNTNEVDVFLNKFESEVNLLKEQQVNIEQKLLDEMREQGKMLAPLIIPELQKSFPGFKLLAAEEDILEEIKE
jgi:hypothetical protein